MKLRYNNIAVTGGAGFIGSHLVRLLHDEGLGTIPIVYDNLSRGSIANLSGLSYTLHEGDLSKYVPDFNGIVTVFHLAAKVTGIQYNRLHHYDMMMSNLAINLNVARAIERAGTVNRVIWVSTACVYPHNAPVPTPEDGTADICDPEPTNRGYGIAKWVGEQMALYMHRELLIPVTVVRFFNAIGLRDHYDDETSHVTPALIKRVLRGDDPMVVWGSGKQTRALVDAGDLASALVMLAECNNAVGEIVNIGHQQEVSIGTLAGIIIDAAFALGYIDNLPGLQFDPSKPDGYARRAADTTKLRRLIGWVPDTPLIHTVENMIHEHASSIRDHTDMG